MTSATAGLEMALEVAGIGPGDEVIVPAMSFAASANVVARLRAKPVFVDIELSTRNIDLELVPAAITSRTRAIMPVHFSGLPVNMERLYGLAADHGLRVVEDAAHAIGSRYADKPIGSFGDLVVFSFHPNKNMTSIEGGADQHGRCHGGGITRAISIPRHQAQRRRAKWTSCFPGRKAISPMSRRRSASINCAAWTDSTQRRRALALRYFEELGGFSGRGACRRAAIRDIAGICSKC